MNDSNDSIREGSNYRGNLTLDRTWILTNLEYDETSPTCLRWRKKTNSRAMEGSVAGTVGGRSLIGIQGKKYKTHRVVWTLFYGDPGDLIVDHINRDPTDNRIDNLRLANFSQSTMNTSPQKRGKSKFKGVHYESGRKKCWVCKFRQHKKRFYSELDAAQQYNEWVLQFDSEFSFLNQITPI